MDVLTEFLNRYVYTPECKLWMDFTRQESGCINLATWSATAANNGNWTAANVTIADEVGTVKTSAHSIKVTNTAAWGHAQQTVKVSPNTTYALTVWCNSDVGNNDDNCNIALRFDNSGVTKLGDFGTAGAWALKTLTVTSNSADTEVDIELSSYDEPGVVVGEICTFDGVELRGPDGLIDLSHHGSTFNLNGTTQDGSKGRVFDGVDDYIWLPNAEIGDLDFTTENFSIFVRGEFNTGAASQHIVSTRFSAAEGYGLILSATEELEFNTWGGSDISTDSPASQIGVAETATLSMSRDSVAVVNLYKNGNYITENAGTHVALTSSRSPFTLGRHAGSATNFLNATLKSALILNRPVGAVEQADIARMLEEICP